jgi:hypothetical protein
VAAAAAVAVVVAAVGTVTNFEVYIDRGGAPSGRRPASFWPGIF